MESGSSPPARGLQLIERNSLAHRRLIPACAGTTMQNGASNRGIRAHPRLRGDYNNTDAILWQDAGSSPPARGLPTTTLSACRIPRLIPACAGTTLSLGPANTYYKAHPRLRGDYVSRHSYTICRIGSSPPARGLLAVVCLPYRRNRLIPACAGTTIQACFFR